MSLVVNVLTPTGKGSLVGVPGVTVELVGRVTVKTDKRGQAVVAKIDPGVYDLKVREGGESPKWAPWYDEKATEYWHQKHVEAMKKVGRKVDEHLADGVNGVRVKAGMNSVDVWLSDRTVTLPSAAAAAEIMAKIQQSRELLLRGAALAERVYELAETARASRTFMEDKRNRSAGAAGSLNSVAALAEILRGEDPVHAAYYGQLASSCQRLAQKLYKVVGTASFYERVEGYAGTDQSLQLLSKRMKAWNQGIASLAAALLDKENQALIKEVFSYTETYAVYSAMSRLIPHYWQQAGTPRSTDGVDARLLLDAALALALRELLNAPFATGAIDQLFGAPDGGADAPVGRWLKSFEEFLGRAANGFGPATAVIGNLPGPPSLWVVAAQHRALQMVKKAALGTSPKDLVGQVLTDLNERYRLKGKALSADELDGIRKGLLAPDGKTVRGAQQRLYDWVGDTVHTQPRMHGLMTVFQLVLAALAYSKIQSASPEAETLDYVSLVIPMVNTAAGTATGALATAAALTPQQSGRVVSLVRGSLPHLGRVASVGAVGGFVVSIIAVAQLPPHASAVDRVFAWIDLASTGLGAAGVVVGLVSGVVAAKFFAAGAIIGGLGVGAKLAIEASYTGVTKVILGRVDGVARDGVLTYLVSDVPNDCRAIVDIDVLNRWQFGKSFRPDKATLKRLKDELMFGDAEISDMVVP